MTALPALFADFLSNIRPTDQNRQDYKDGHETLRDYLHHNEMIHAYYVADFLQGSYRRSTAVKPIGDEKSDIDIVLVTNIDKSNTSPNDAMAKCKPFLNEHYEDQWTANDRSYKIEEGSVELDLVLTAAPSEVTQEALAPDGPFGSLSVEDALELQQTREAVEKLDFTAGVKSEEWKLDPLDIPDCRLEAWEKTHPLYTIAWTSDKNDRTNGHYVNVVKAIKWWRRTQVADPERPKGYPLEHIVGSCCPDGIESVAEGVTRTFETIRHKFEFHARTEQTPVLSDRGIPENNVLARIDGEDFVAFYDKAVDAGDVARQALDEEDPSASRKLWHSLFGEEFPEYGRNDGSDDGDEKASTQFRPSSETASVSNERFA